MNPPSHALVVEDDPPMRKLLDRHLTSLGWTVDVASDGLEGLSLWECNEYDLVFTDVSMPGMNGFELASRIRSSGRHMAEVVPVIAITGHAKDRTRSAAAGMTDCISKPFTILDVQRVLDRWVPGVRRRASPKPVQPGSGDLALRVAAPYLPDDVAIMQSIRLTFIQTIPEYIRALRGACEAGSTKGIADAVHKLKSAARLVGGDAVADLCEAVESASQNTDITVLVEMAGPIPDAVEDLEKSLKGISAPGAPESTSRTR